MQKNHALTTSLGCHPTVFYSHIIAGIITPIILMIVVRTSFVSYLSNK